MKFTNKKAFTVVELITVVAIIAILLGVLMPALNLVRTSANKAKCQTQLSSISIAITMFKNDMGDFPQSVGKSSHGTPDYRYTGAQTLTEALMGQDLLGFHPQSEFESIETYEGESLYPTNPNPANLDIRKGPYLDRSGVGVFTAGSVFGDNFRTYTGLYPQNYLICDSFTNYKRTITNPYTNKETKYKVGTPILYFKADTSKMDIDVSNPAGSIYNFVDNGALVMQGKIEQNKVDNDSDIRRHEGLIESNGDGDGFYEFITDQLVTTTTVARPVNPDTFLLISAGADGFYGTVDDVCNFTPNL